VQNQKTELESKIALLEESLNMTKSKLAVTEEMKMQADKDRAECDESLSQIKDKYGAFKEKLGTLKSELHRTFPKNLNEANFSIVEEDGRLVITLPNKILYKKGEADFDEQALSIIQKLSKVFRANPGLQILVEGHTDDIPLKDGSKFSDNWDLSMARAVNIVRQLETYGVHPSRLTAAGRGYFAPKSRIDSEEARALNRRTEIVIRPKLAEFLQLMDGI
jgi:chemotaxis protein MotB